MGRVASFLNKLTRATPQQHPNTGVAVSQLPHSQDQFSPDRYGDYIATSNDVYSVVNLRAKMLAKLSLKYFDSKHSIVEDGHDVGRLLRHINPHWTWRRMLMMYQMSMSIWGQCYWFIEYDNAGNPRELWWVKPTRVQPVVGGSTYISHYEYTPVGSNVAIKVPVEEVIWFRYPNIIDQFTGLSPLAAARLAADFASASMLTNVNLFDQGLMMGGMLMPPKDTELSKTQAADLELQLQRRFTGSDKAHRWAVFHHDFQVKEMSITPKDAEFIQGLNMSFRQVCRAYGVPPPLLGDAEFATLANLSVYERQLWTQTMEFEASFFAEELNEQLLIRFRRTPVVSVAFDLDAIEALQEDKVQREEREAAQIKDGRMTVNEWRDKNGLDAVEWGDTWWKHALFVPADTEVEFRDTTPSDDQRSRTIRATDLYQSDEVRLSRMLQKLMARQYDAVISTLNKRTVKDAVKSPFNKTRWIAEYARGTEPLLISTVTKASVNGADLVGTSLSDSLDEIDGLAETVTKQAAKQSVEMAKGVNETLWNDLRALIGDGLDDGLSTEDLTTSIRGILGPDAAEWRARRIASTEVTKSTSFGQMEVWRALEVKSKRWVTQGDSNVRDTHAALNGTVIRLDDAFTVGGCIADAPGLSGCGEEDINCRCRVEPVTGRSGGVASLTRINDLIGEHL